MYFEKLKKDYPKQLLKRYMDHMYVLEQRPPCVPLYEEEKQTLQKILKIDGGKAQVLQLMKKWRDKYPTRKAMHRMFDEIEEELWTYG